MDSFRFASIYVQYPKQWILKTSHWGMEMWKKRKNDTEMVTLQALEYRMAPDFSTVTWEEDWLLMESNFNPELNTQPNY
jgi:hypothetical protein